MFRRALVATAALALGAEVSLHASIAHADPACLGCRAIEITFQTPSTVPTGGAPDMRPQMVIWLETADGHMIETAAPGDGAPIYITQQTGTFGIGNRPGRYDFNSGPLWPYGRRETVFPIWAHRRTAIASPFPRVVFQSGTESDLSHAMATSSPEVHFCRPLHDTGADQQYWDTGTCASQSYTDKGHLSAQDTSLYPPRADLLRSEQDSADVATFDMINPFDAVSQATPAAGATTTVTWSIPADFPLGDYVVWVEVSKEFDYNATYNQTSYPAPDVFYGDYGLPYRGQPSVVYRVPISVGMDSAMGQTTDYVGYGDPTGEDGDVRAPDATITTDVPGSGGARLAMLADERGSFRVRAEVSIEHDCVAPGAPMDLAYVGTDGRTSTVSFVAPGDDGDTGTARGYEIRYRVGSEPIATEADFEAAQPLTTQVVPEPGGATQLLPIDTLLPETDYVVAVRAYDNCMNEGPIASLAFTTPARQTGEVDACFVATAAYGSLMAGDVPLLRHFRDAVLRHSVFGELAVESYYTFGPAFAGAIGESDLLRATARAALAPIVARVKTAAF